MTPLSPILLRDVKEDEIDLEEEGRNAKDEEEIYGPLDGAEGKRKRDIISNILII